MSKHYLFWMILLLPFMKLDAQTYCTPTTGTSTAYYLKNAIFSDQGALYYDASSYQAYVNNSASQVVTSYPGGTVKVHLEFVGSGAKSLVWVDWNANGDFNDFYENPIGTSNFTTVDDQFFVPPSQAPGIYRIRVQTGTGLSSTSNPCGPNPNGNGNFVDFSLQIVATPSCIVPVSLVSSNVTNNSATIGWDAPATAPNSYEYYYSTSNVVPDATTVASGSTAGLSAPISGLSSFTTYYYYARSVCGGTKTNWSLRGIFKTKCDPMTSMFENFENVPTSTSNADCWDKIMLGTGSLSMQSTSGVGGSKAMFQYANGAANTTIAVLPKFSNINAGTHWLRFKARVSSTAGSLDIGYVTNDTDANSFVNIQSVSIANTVFDGFEYSVVVPNTVPANARLAIRHNGAAPAASFYWDNVYWEPKPTCTAPTNVILSNMTSATVDAAWTAPASAPGIGYDIYYSTNSTPPTSTSVPNLTGITANPYTIQGLSSATTYYIWVRSRCSATDQSAWTNIASALTLCAPVTTLSENFDSYGTAAFTSLPCWGRVQTGYGATNTNGNGAMSGTRHILQRSIAVGDVTIAILPELSNINAGTHSLKFNAYCSVANTGKLEVGYMTNPTDASTFTLIQQLDIINTSYAPTTGTSEYSVNIPNTVPAGARLAIRNTYALSGSAQYFWDNISWAPTVVLGVSDISAKQDIVIYPNPFTDTITISGDVQLQSVVVYDLSGKMIKEFRGSEKTISLHSLRSGVYMVKLNMKNGSSKTVKAVKK